MESVADNPLTLAFAQLVVLILNLFVYARQKSHAAIEKRGVDGFGRDLGRAVQLAEAATAAVSEFNISKYEALKTKYEEQSLELSRALGRIAAMEETISSLSNKLASRDRADALAAKKAAKTVEPPDESEDALEQLIKNGQAIPLRPAQAPTPTQTGFGKVAR